MAERGTETKAERVARLARAEEEIQARGEFDFVLTNDELEPTVAKLAGIMGLTG
ncbi:MAG: hypothetical protein LBG11_08330 [Bifidobacteriaceae bacterium]|nr:hypothetical protein [Bifidobacteriaceae bacterium]